MKIKKKTKSDIIHNPYVEDISMIENIEEKVVNKVEENMLSHLGNYIEEPFELSVCKRAFSKSPI